MIVSQLYGGLGNQLFQYAMGRALAARRQTTLALDTSKFETYTLRSYRLQHFAITARPLTARERRALHIPSERTGVVRRLISRVVRTPFMPVVRERSFRFDACVLQAPAHCYLEGYWQSPKYFASIESVIRREFRLCEPLTDSDAAMKSRMARQASVSVHVRRGDYISNRTTALYHGTCSPAYYLSAEDRLRRLLGELTLFVFSDDPAWCEANLRFKSRTFIVRQDGPDRDYVDLELMSSCQHHIIANSTFGWWGAWLCPNPAKIVITPKNWFQDSNISAEDLVPENWLRL